MTAQLPIQKERLEGIARGEKCYTHDDVVQVVRALLVVQKQKPVAYIIQDAEMRTRGNPGFLSYDGSISNEDKNEYEISITPLYTRPAPVPAVPVGYVLAPVEPTVAMTEALWDEIHESRDMNNAYRAMLAAAPTTPDGWIPVSERMPNCFYYVLVADEHDDFAIASPVDLSTGDKCAFRMNDGCIFFATHWQPIPDMPKVTP